MPAVGDPVRALDPAKVPVRLQVPSIGVDVPLIRLGTNPDGSLEVPADYQQVGWFTGSAAPGDTGPSVIAGHVDSKDGPAPFFRLRDLSVGARVVVTAADGADRSFTVDGVQQYPKDAFPTGAVYGPAPGPVLRLITCGGSFDRATGHYRDNVVVFAS
ncbi:class F sortase [Kineococcus rhizosphaerae]|uniref:Sortase family protein n=1 Tax=Kineococcus rhizosphaerae TaxID=559628 RepID=A0A2T0R5F4_9ACTN|nr:class F sortase [Kineococcus rhizosphaerae]PRY15974.1 sortase family protein [Kineococcus rhizosphaerae]